MKDQYSLLSYLYHEASEKYRKYNLRIEKAIHDGRFKKFSRRKRSALLHRLKKLTQQLKRYYLQLKLAGAGAALGLTLSLFNPASAQTTLGPYEQTERGENVLRGPYRFGSRPAPALVDWDNDGDLDLVIGGFGSGGVSYFEYTTSENGNGYTERTGDENPFNFLNLYDYSARVPMFFDYDDDGDKDLFLGTSSNDIDNVLYFKNEEGTLVLQTPSEDWNPETKTGNPFKSLGNGNYNDKRPVIAFIDRDNDGDYDALISQELEATGMYYYRNDPFVDTEADPPVNTIVYTIADDEGIPEISGYNAFPIFADLDEDGDQDLIIGGLDGLKYFTNDGDNNFEEQEGPFDPDSYTGNPFYDFYFQEPNAPAIGDIDGDGDLDIIVGQTGSFLGEAPAYLENQTDPEEPKNLLFVRREGFDNPMDGYINPADYTHSYRGSVPAFIDVDNDGDMDVLIGEKYTSNIVYFENENGKYVKTESPLVGGVFTDDSFPTIVDINGDGFDDVYVGLTGNSEPIPPEPRTLLYLNNHDGTFTLATPEEDPLSEQILLASELRLAFIDLDGDELLDVIASQEFGGLRFFKNTGTYNAPSFTKDETLDPFPDGLGYKPLITTVDMDGDHDTDIVVGSHLSGLGIRVFINDDLSNSFNEIGESDNPLDHVDYTQTMPGFVDIDQDGDTDMFVNIIGGEFLFFRNENPAPQLTTEYNTIEFGVNADPIFINPSFTLSDEDSDEYSEARISIIGYEPGKDFLGYSGVDLSEELDWSFNEDAGVFTVSRNGDETAYLTMLQGITYQYIDEPDEPDGDQRKKNPAGRTITKTIRFEVFDADRTTPQHVDFTLTHNNIPPALSSTAPGATFTSTSGAVPIDNTIVITDDDDLTISSASISITSGLVTTEDRLEFIDPLGILSGTYLTGTGQLLITGVASKAYYLIVLRTVRYNNIAAFPDFTPRTIEFTVNDGEDDSPVSSVSVGFNLSPALTLSQSAVAYSGTPQIVDNGLTILDDNSGISSAVLTFSTGYVSTEDRLSFTNQAGITGVFDPAAGTLTLSGNATKTDYQNAIRTIAYTNLSSPPTTTPRVISISLLDASGNASNLVSLNVNFTSQNPPALVTTITAVNYVTGSLVVSNDFSVADPDDTQMESASVTISTGHVPAEDLLSFTPSGGITGSFDAPTGLLTLTGTAAITDYQTVLRSVTYQNTNTGDRNKGTRTLIFRVNDGTDNSNMINIAVNLPNQVPALTNAGSPIQYSSGSILVADQISLTDGDNATFQSAVVQITAGFVSGEDILLFTDQNGITGSFDSGTGTLQLAGAASIANYQIAIRSVRYQNVNAGDRNKNSRTITVSANDGISNSNAGTISLTIPNQAPSITAGTNPPLYGSGALAIFNGITIADNDNATLQSATISITSGLRSNEDQLLFTAQNGITGSFTPATGTLQLTGASSKANYETAIRSIQYQNSSSSPDVSTRTLSVTINDGITSSNAITVTLGINQPPVIVVDEPVIGAGGSVNFNISDLASDPDNNLDLNNINSVTITSQPSSGAVASIVNGVLTIDYSAVPNFTGIDRLTITICDNLNRCTSQEITIQVGAELEVYNAVSAFKDGYNDFFYLRYIEPENKVTIFNRWGDKVFERVNYDNNDASKRFEGFNDNGDKLPSGTYFYKIEYGATLAASGYLTLKQ